MNIKFFNSAVFVFTAVVAWVSLISGCVAQSGTTRVPKQGAEARAATQGSATRTAAAAATTHHPALLDPTRATETAPDKFHVKFNTTKGAFVVEVDRSWAPNGADRFYNMCRTGYFKDIAIFRSIKGFMFQFGIHGDPKVSAQWMKSNIQDDKPVGKSNVPGTLSFAQTGRPNSRAVQMFVNTANNSFLDKSQRGGTPFVPFGKIVSGMNVVPKIHVTDENEAEVQGKFQQRGNDYIKSVYPNLDYIRSVEISVTN